MTDQQLWQASALLEALHQVSYEQRRWQSTRAVRNSSTHTQAHMVLEVYVTTIGHAKAHTLRMWRTDYAEFIEQLPEPLRAELAAYFASSTVKRLALLNSKGGLRRAEVSPALLEIALGIVGLCEVVGAVAAVG